MSEMFCFQCEQTAMGKGCEHQAGVCGKKSDTANLQDELIEEIVKLSNIIRESNEETDDLVLRALFMSITNVNYDNEAIKDLILEIRALDLSSGDFTMQEVWRADEDIRSLKTLILLGIKGIAAYAHHAMRLGYQDEELMDFIYEDLRTIATNKSTDELFQFVMKTGEMCLKSLKLLDKANTERFGMPSPAQVSTNIEKGPFIVVTGHDLLDLEELLEQTKDKGINIYTHSEMLPCHAYPELRKYPHLKGNFGTAWQNQQKEFENIPAPILFTTNCIMPPKDSYSDRVFTTDVVGYEGIAHIKEVKGKKDFTPLINKAIELKGYSEEQKMTGINNGDVLTTGFGWNYTLSIAADIIEAVKSGAIKHFFLVGGCDGAKPGRNYYTEFVKKTPKDSVIITLACGKYRFNDLDLGTIDSIPRILDMGQCNDAYSAIKVVQALAEAFGVGINELPLSMVLSWYEQKAVCILLALLHLGVKNILIGPSMPAFISPNVLNILVEKFNIGPISTPEEDLAKILNK